VRKETARLACAIAMYSLLTASPGFAQAEYQLWGNVTLDWVKSHRLTYELDVWPQVLLDPPQGDPGWWELDATPAVQYSPKRWLDLVGQVKVGYTKQTDDMNSVELTPSGGVRLHLFPQGLPVSPLRERVPSRRVVIRDLARVESRNLLYMGAGSGSSSTVRCRNRLEVLVPLNRQKLTDTGARYVLADWELFWPLDDPAERYASKARIRAGVGYRRSVAWRYELLYVWNRSRNTIDEGFATTNGAIDIRVRRVF
jgi:hypothetical protein